MRCSKILCVLLLAILGSPAIHAQTYVVSEDNFTNRAVGWPLGRTNEYALYLDKDYFVIDKKSRTVGPTLFAKYLTYDPSDYFELESKFRAGTKDTLGFGIAWGIKDGANYYTFTISTATHSYRVTQYINGDYLDIIPWTKAYMKIKDNFRPNTLMIKRDGDSIYFYVNDYKLDSRPFEEFDGPQTGFVVNDKVAVCADYFIVRKKGKINLIEGMDKRLKKERLDNNINTGNDEHQPIITPDGKTLYVARKSPRNMGGVNDADDIWFSYLKPDSTWSEMENLGPPLNNAINNAVMSATPDNNTLMLLGSYETDPRAERSEFSLSHETNNGWSKPDPILIDSYYNFHKYISINLSTDGKTMLLGLERKDTKGDADIYVSFLQEDGRWSVPKNLGNTINTPGQEHDPFLAADGVTLYYSTDGCPGYGWKDIFVSRRLDDSWQNWSTPQNLGPLVNTPQDDEEFVLAASGAYAYFSSEVSENNRDIFRLKMSKQAKPKVVTMLFGKVTSCKTKNGVNATLTYTDLSNNKEVGVARTSPIDGSFKIALPAGKKYLLRTADENFVTTTDTIDVTNETAYREIIKNIDLCANDKSKNVPNEVKERKVNVQQTVTIKNKKVQIQIWDDEMEDGDIVSLNINGNWVLENYTLKKERKTIEVELNLDGNYLVMYAINEGKNPPNTAAISIIDGGVEKRLLLKSTLKASAAINLQFKP